VAYVSYDGIGEPLGQSQVLAYLERLAGAVEITLLSFEKRGTVNEALRSRVNAAGIRWLPLRYHKRPPVLSTLWDVVRGTCVLVLVSRRRPDIVHARSYVPALIFLLARPLSGAKFLFDIRGFWVDERVAGGRVARAGGKTLRASVLRRC
jgi:hypothetical protein